jgi:uncharacterized protein YdcH (DUF465 family)
MAAPAGKTAEQLQSEFQGRRAAAIAKIMGDAPPKAELAEDVPVIETPAGPVRRAKEAPVEAPAAEEPTAADVAEEPAVEAAAEATTPEGDALGESHTGEESRAERIEKAVRKAKSESRHFKRLQAESAQKDHQIRQTQQQLQQAQAAARRGAQIEKAIRENPLKAVEQFGVTAEQLAQAAVMAGTTEEKLAILQKQLEVQNAERVAEKKAADLAKQNAAIEAKNAQLMSEFTRKAANVTRYPNLAGWDASVLADLALAEDRRASAKHFKKTGVELHASDPEMLKWLNNQLSPKTPKVAAAPKSAAATAAPSKAKTPPKATESPRPAASPRTVTSSQTAGSFNRPSNWESLPRAARMKALQKAYG